jgi:hypothetical protein
MANDRLNDSPGGEIAPSHASVQRSLTGGRHSDDSNSADSHRADARWQRRLLPFLVGTLGVLTVLFCAAIAWETRYIQNRMESALELDLRPAMNQEFRANAAFLLEADLIERRYRAADAAALSRIYLMFLGFGTGMVMALVGATFVLGKIAEPATSIDGSGSSFKASLHSGSPGVILAFFGTVLMLCTIFSKTEISLSDRAIYMGAGSEQGATAQPDAQSKMPEKSTTSDPEKPETKGLLADKQNSAAATPAALAAKNDGRQADLQLRMNRRRTVDGEYNLELRSGPGTLSISDQQVKFAGRDGKKRKLEVIVVEPSHVAFSVVEPDGGRQEFDGFLTNQNDIVGSTSYHGSLVLGPVGFVATRINQK